MTTKQLIIYFSFFLSLQSNHTFSASKDEAPDYDAMVGALPDGYADAVMRRYAGFEFPKQKTTAEVEAQIANLASTQTKRTLAAGTFVIAGSTGLALAAKAIQRPVRTRVFGIDDAIIGSAASGIAGKLGSGALQTLPYIACAGGVCFGYWKIKKWVNASHRADMREMRAEFQDEINHVKLHVAAARDEMAAAQRSIEEVQAGIEETRETNLELKAKVGQAGVLVGRLLDRTGRMAAAAKWDLEAVKARRDEEISAGKAMARAKPAPKKKKHWWNF